MDTNVLKALARIRFSDDGSYLIDLLEKMSNDNYKILKYCDVDMQQIMIGRAQMVDEIKDLILSADVTIKESTKADPSNWSL